MPVIHIVLVQVKQAVLSNGFDELKQKCETLKDLPIAKAKATEIRWGPPVYPGRNQGYNWGEYGLTGSACSDLTFGAYRNAKESSADLHCLTLLSVHTTGSLRTDRSLQRVCLSRRLRGVPGRR